MSSYKFFSIICGIVFMIAGIRCLSGKPQFIKEGFLVYGWVGYALIATSIGLVIHAFLIVKPNQFPTSPARYSICQDCMHIFEPDDSLEKECPKCGGRLEPLEGFYNRHPDLKGSHKGEPDKLD